MIAANWLLIGALVSVMFAASFLLGMKYSANKYASAFTDLLLAAADAGKVLLLKESHKGRAVYVKATRTPPKDA